MSVPLEKKYNERFYSWSSNKYEICIALCSWKLLDVRLSFKQLIRYAPPMQIRRFIVATICFCFCFVFVFVFVWFLFCFVFVCFTSEVFYATQITVQDMISFVGYLWYYNKEEYYSTGMHIEGGGFPTVTLKIKHIHVHKV